MSMRLIILEDCFGCPYASPYWDEPSCRKVNRKREGIETPDWCPLPEAVGYIMADGNMVSWEGTGKYTLPEEPSIFEATLESKRFCVEIESGTWMFGSDGIYFKPTDGDVIPVLEFKKKNGEVEQ